MYMARTFMVHASLHWTEHGVDDISLWPFAVKHAVWLYNRVPNHESGLTPMEFITKQKADHSDLLRSHVVPKPPSDSEDPDATEELSSLSEVTAPSPLGIAAAGVGAASNPSG